MIFLPGNLEVILECCTLYDELVVKANSYNSYKNFNIFQIYSLILNLIVLVLAQVFLICLPELLKQ